MKHSVIGRHENHMSRQKKLCVNRTEDINER